MDDIEVERNLIHFSGVNIDKFVDENNEPGLTDIINDITRLDKRPLESVIDDQEAVGLRIDPKGPEDGTDSSLSDETVDSLRFMAIKIVNLLNSSQNNETHKKVQEITKYIWPLYSRDVRTNMIGFDLQEYADYFQNLPSDEREKLAKQLFSEWGIEK